MLLECRTNYAASIVQNWSALAHRNASALARTLLLGMLFDEISCFCHLLYLVCDLWTELLRDIQQLYSLVCACICKHTVSLLVCYLLQRVQSFGASLCDVLTMLEYHIFCFVEDELS